MRILLVGAGGVGGAAAAIAVRRDFVDLLVVADYDLDRARAVVDRLGDPRLRAVRLDASDEAAVAAALAEHGTTALLNATDPRFVMPLFRAALAGGATYLDMAMSLSVPHPDAPYERTGVKLGDEQFALADAWEDAGRLALVGIGVEPGLSDVFARYAADHLFSAIDELGVRDGADLTVARLRLRADVLDLDDDRGVPQPAGVWERDRGWFTTAPFSEPGGVRLPRRASARSSA